MALGLRVSKDSKGFDDIESFWKASDVVVDIIDTSSSDEYDYETSSTISGVSDEETTIVEPTKEDISVTVSDESSLTIPESTIDEQETDPQESQDEILPPAKPPKIPTTMNPKNRRVSAPGAIASTSNPSRRTSPSPMKSNLKQVDPSPQFGAGRISIIPQAENPYLPSPPSNLDQTDFPDFGDLGAPDDDDDFNYSFDQPPPPKQKNSPPKPKQNSPPNSKQRSEKIGQNKANQSKQASSSSPVATANQAPKGKEEVKKSSRSKTVIPVSDDEVEENREEEVNESSSFSSPSVVTPIQKTNKRRISFLATPVDTPGSTDFPIGREVDDDSYSEGEERDGDAEGDTTMDLDTSGMSLTKSYVDTSFLRAAKKRIYESDDELSVESQESEQYEDDRPTTGMRKSSRATKGQRLQYWKNERFVFVKGKLQGALRSDPTPQKVRRVTSKSKRNDTKKIKRVLHPDSSSESELEAPREQKPVVKEIPPQIPRNIKHISRADRILMHVLNRDENIIVEDEIVTLAESLSNPAMLPITAPRPKGKTEVGLASQAFNVAQTGHLPGWIAGSLILPPGAIKDAEGVGEACQVFVVSSCQNGAVELGIGNPEYEEWDDDTSQRMLLKTGDFFHVPPGNMYRLENYSKSTPCLIYWTILRPIETAEIEEEGNTSDEMMVESSPLKNK